LGADVFVQPAIEIRPVRDLVTMDAALERLARGDFAGVAFTSQHAVEAVCDRLWERGYDQRVFAGVQLAVVGDKTAQVLAARGLRADWVPSEQFNAERLLEVLASQASVAGQAWFLPQADRARETLAEGLAKLGAKVEVVVVYRAVAPEQLRADMLAALEKGQIQWVTVTSSQAARTLHQLCGPYLAQLRPLSLSPAISDVLAQLGWPAGAQARQATEAALVEALLEVQAARDGDCNSDGQRAP
jgi:uroporphyrinogen III methyltransferase/synthase